MSKKIDKLKFDFEHLSEEPSSDLWNQLEEKLDAKKEPLFAKAWLIVAASLVVLASLVWTFWNKEMPTDTFVKQTEVNVTNANQKEEVHKVEKVEVISDLPTEEIIASHRIETPIVQSKKEHTSDKTNNVISPKKEHQNSPSKEKTINEQFVKETNTPESDTMKNIAHEEINLQKKTQNYISADELLFQRSLNETEQKHQNTIQSTLGKNIETNIKPQSIEIIGIEIYNADNHK